MQRCKDRIDREGGDQSKNLLAVSHVFAKLHFDRPELLSILRGRKMLTDMPFIQELIEDSKRDERVKSILGFLTGRFGSPHARIEAGLKRVPSSDWPEALTLTAATYADLAEFEAALTAELPRPRPASTRGKRKQK